MQPAVSLLRPIVIDILFLLSLSSEFINIQFTGVPPAIPEADTDAGARTYRQQKMMHQIGRDVFRIIVLRKRALVQSTNLSTQFTNSPNPKCTAKTHLRNGNLIKNIDFHRSFQFRVGPNPRPADLEDPAHDGVGV